jgi:hypothetical protein
LRITAITVHYGETQSLPEYSNVKPALTLTAELAESDDAATAEAELWAMAKRHVQEQVDLALEQNGRAAKYDPAPRYQVMRTYNDRYGPTKDEPQPPIVVVVFPTDTELDRKRYGRQFVHAGRNSDSRKLRYEHAMRLAAEESRENDNAPILDCSDGDLSRLDAALAEQPLLFDEEAARAQENTSPEYREAMGLDNDNPLL